MKIKIILLIVLSLSNVKNYSRSEEKILANYPYSLLAFVELELLSLLIFSWLTSKIYVLRIMEFIYILVLIPFYLLIILLLGCLLLFGASILYLDILIVLSIGFDDLYHFELRFIILVYFLILFRLRLTLLLHKSICIFFVD